MRSFWIALVALITLIATSCGEDVADVAGGVTSENEFFEYFYPYDTVAKVYQYRNISNGLEEQFHRVFGINDSQGQHIVVEVYTDDWRLLEAINYNVDSLNVIDHMVVDKDQENNQAMLSANQLIPMDRKNSSEFASNFPGIMDSTFFLQYIKRSFDSEMELDVMGSPTKAVKFNEEVVLKLYNPFNQTEDAREGSGVRYFAKGFGLTEWHDTQKLAHYRLEKILSQNEFVNLMDAR